MRKFTLIMLAAVFMLTWATACSGKTEQDIANTDSPVLTTETAAQTEATEEKEQTTSALDEEEIPVETEPEETCNTTEPHETATEEIGVNEDAVSEETKSTEATEVTEATDPVVDSDEGAFNTGEI